jgi:hypothetical protein
VFLAEPYYTPLFRRIVYGCPCISAFCVPSAGEFMFRCLLAAILLFGSTAAAQVFPPYTWCRVAAGPPSLIRAEGLAEKVNDIVITCSGGNTAEVVTASFTVALNNAPVTSRIVAPASGGSETLLLVDDLSAPPSLGTNVFQGAVYGNQVVFTNVPIVPPVSPAVRTFRVTNLRVNARDLPENSLVHASVAISGVMTSDPVVAVALKAPGVSFSIQTGAGAPLQTFAIQPGGGGALTHRLRFTEGFAQSFRKRNAATGVSTPTALSDQNVVGTDYHTECGYYNSALPSDAGLNQAGLATQGTRLVARFTNVPAGVSLYVTTRPLPNTGASSAVLTAADLNGAGAYSAAAQSGAVTVDGSSVGIAPVSLTNGAGTPTWEILDSDHEALEAYSFGVVAVSGQSGSATLVGGLGPISAISVADTSSSAPRFVDMSARAAACAASPCLTAAPGAIFISYQTGTAAPGPITIQVGSTGTPMSFTTAVAASPDGWLSVTPSGGVTPAGVQVTIDPTRLYPDVYQGNIVLSGTTQTVYIPVIVSVTVGPSGYVPLGCTVFSANPTQARSEGMTEVLGDLMIQCTGGTPTAAGAQVPAVDVKVTLPTPITSRTYANGWSEVLLIIDEAGFPAPGVSPQLACSDASGSCAITGTGDAVGTYSGATGRPNVFIGRVTGNVVTFPSVPIDAPGNGGFQMYGFTYGRTLRIVNLRADATIYPPSQFPGQAFVSGVVSAGTIAVKNPVQTLGFLFPALGFSLRTPDNSAVSTGPAMANCAPPGVQRAGVLHHLHRLRNRVLHSRPHVAAGEFRDSRSGQFRHASAGAHHGDPFRLKGLRKHAADCFYKRDAGRVRERGGGASHCE